MNDHEHLEVMARHRFYMVGKLIRQDLGGTEPGYRETLVCPCHVDAYVNVLGPHLREPRYSAVCGESGKTLNEANTMEELWSAVERSAKPDSEQPELF